MTLLIKHFIRRYWWVFPLTFFYIADPYPHLDRNFPMTFLGFAFLAGIGLVGFDISRGATRVYVTLPISRKAIAVWLWVIGVIIFPAYYFCVQSVFLLYSPFASFEYRLVFIQILHTTVLGMGCAAVALLIALNPKRYFNNINMLIFALYTLCLFWGFHYLRVGKEEIFGSRSLLLLSISLLAMFYSYRQVNLWVSEWGLPHKDKRRCAKKSRTDNLMFVSRPLGFSLPWLICIRNLAFVLAGFAILIALALFRVYPRGAVSEPKIPVVSFLLLIMPACLVGMSLFGLMRLKELRCLPLSPSRLTLYCMFLPAIGYVLMAIPVIVFLAMMPGHPDVPLVKNILILVPGVTYLISMIVLFIGPIGAYVFCLIGGFAFFGANLKLQMIPPVSNTHAFVLGLCLTVLSFYGLRFLIATNSKVYKFRFFTHNRKANQI